MGTLEGSTAGQIDKLGGTAGNISGWRLLLYNGNNDKYYDEILLSGIIPDQQSGFGTLSLLFPPNGIQNGSPDGMALVDPGNQSFSSSATRAFSRRMTDLQVE